MCAQAVCLEEMRDVRISEGALWYQQEHKREQVTFDDALRLLTLTTIQSARQIIESKQTPAPLLNKTRCKACSLLDLCLPDVLRSDKTFSYIQNLWTPSNFDEHETFGGDAD